MTLTLLLAFCPCVALAEGAADVTVPSTEVEEVVLGENAAGEQDEQDEQDEQIGQADQNEQTDQIEQAEVRLSGSGHVQRLGWVDATAVDGESIVLGTTGQALRLEALRLSVNGGSVSYQAHVQGIG